MSERVKFRQNRDFEVEYFYTDPNDPDGQDFYPVQGLYEVTPYGLMLFSLASCTAQVVLSYAQHHGVDLESVEFELTYDRTYKEDCDDCENIERYDEMIKQRLQFIGDMNAETRMKLYRIAHQCPIEKMFQQGIKIESELVRESV